MRTSSAPTAPATTGQPQHDGGARLAGPAVRCALPRTLFADFDLPAAPRAVAEPQPGRPVRRRAFRGRGQLCEAAARPGVRNVAGQYVRSDADDRAGADSDRTAACTGVEPGGQRRG